MNNSGLLRILILRQRHNLFIKLFMNDICNLALTAFNKTDDSVCYYLIERVSVHQHV